jgi:hypothetical protein
MSSLPMEIHSKTDNENGEQIFFERFLFAFIKTGIRIKATQAETSQTVIYKYRLSAFLEYNGSYVAACNAGNDGSNEHIIEVLFIDI